MFYKKDNETLCFGNFVQGQDYDENGDPVSFILDSEMIDTYTYTYPYYGWYWFDSDAEAEAFFGVTSTG